MRIAEDARKHAIEEDDMLHAYRCHLRRIEMDNGLTLFIGPARGGALLEIGVLNADSDPALIHADNLRPKFHPYLR